MDALGNVLMFCGVIAFVLGVVTIVWPLHRLGLSRRFDGVLVIAASFALVALAQQVSPELKAQATAQATARAAAAQEAPATRPTPAPAPVRYVSNSEALKSIRLGGLRWEKSGFGTVMVATFTVYNDNPFPIKDVEVTCVHSTNSGTVIDRNTRTIYERLDARGYVAVPEMNMGFIHSAANSTRCAPTDFSRV